MIRALEFTKAYWFALTMSVLAGIGSFGLWLVVPSLNYGWISSFAGMIAYFAWSAYKGFKIDPFRPNAVLVCEDNQQLKKAQRLCKRFGYRVKVQAAYDQILFVHVDEYLAVKLAI